MHGEVRPLEIGMSSCYAADPSNLVLLRRHPIINNTERNVEYGSIG